VTAAGLTATLVQQAIDAATDGQTVCLPAGSSNWDSVVTLNCTTKSLIFRAETAGTVTILDNISRTAATPGRGLTVTIPSGKYCRISGIEFEASRTGSHSNGFISVSGGTDQFRMDHCTFTGWTNSHLTVVMMTDNITGVVDNIDWNGGFVEFLDVRHTAWEGVGEWGDNSWAAATNFGTDEALYIENSTFINTGDFQSLIECSWGGGRYVARYNTIRTYGLGGHGTESGNRGRGIRKVEAYNNTFQSVVGVGLDRCQQIRSGALLFYDNTIERVNSDGTPAGGNPGFNSWVKLWTARAADQFRPWGSCAITSITRSGSTATGTTEREHGLPTKGTAQLTIEGANESEYNDTFTATRTSATTFTFTVSGTPATPATGTIAVYGVGGYADGSNPWDDNDGVIYASGTATTGTTTDSLVDSGANFTGGGANNNLVKYSLRVFRGGVFFRASSISANTATTITTNGSSFSSPHSYTAGDTYEVRKMDYILDQPGRGQCTVLLSGAVPSPHAHPESALEPVRVWNNSGGTPTQSGVGIQAGIQVLDTDYYYSTDSTAALPGYSAYTYPHPLRTSGPLAD
jgi:hypothetical protein